MRAVGAAALMSVALHVAIGAALASVRVSPSAPPPAPPPLEIAIVEAPPPPPVAPLPPAPGPTPQAPPSSARPHASRARPSLPAPTEPSPAEPAPAEPGRGLSMRRPPAPGEGGRVLVPSPGQAAAGVVVPQGAPPPPGLTLPEPAPAPRPAEKTPDLLVVSPRILGDTLMDWATDPEKFRRELGTIPERPSQVPLGLASPDGVPGKESMVYIPLLTGRFGRAETRKVIPETERDVPGALRQLSKRLEAIWKDPRLTRDQRRALIQQLADECDDTDDGRLARATIQGFLRRHP